MKIFANTLKSHYEVLSPIGKGGMGEVYCPLDEWLNRKVAIKILPPDFAADEARLGRFEQGARDVDAKFVGIGNWSPDGTKLSLFIVHQIKATKEDISSRSMATVDLTLPKDGRSVKRETINDEINDKLGK
jgi:serine/threonine protein kinase